MNPAPNLDVTSLIIAAALTALVQAGAMFFIYLTRKTYPGFGAWTITYLVHGVGLLLLVSRGRIPDLFSVVISNLMTAGAPLVVWVGVQAFFGVRRPRWPFLGLLGLLGVGLGYFWYVKPDLDARIIMIAVVMGGLCLAGAWDLWRLAGPDLRQASRFTAISLGVYGVLALSRGLTPLSSQAPGTPFENTLFQGLFFMFSVLVGVIPSYGMITMNAQRLEGELHARDAEVRATVEDLTRALAEVKTLSDLLPICSSCKKIRNDAGYWQQVDNYFAERSGLRFTHGICPDCLSTLYPEVAHKVNGQGEKS